MKELKDYKIVCIDGETYRLVPENEFNEKICPQEQEKKTGWERAKGNETVYSIDMTEFGCYFRDAEFARSIGRAVSLWLRMLRWQAENDIPANSADRWSIYYKGEADKIYRAMSGRNWNEPFIIYFSSAKKAYEAIEAFKDDLLWYFTEFKSRMDG